jgi:DNA repair protein RadC
MKIKDLPWYDRPDFKLTKKGVQALSDSELLSIIFWSNNKEDEYALSISNRILKEYNLHKLEDAGFNEILNIVKLNKFKKAEYSDFKKVRKLLSLIELSKRYNKLKNKGYKYKISSAKDVYDYFVDEYSSKKKEYFICLYLDTKNNIIKDEEISVGTLNSSLVHPREVFVGAIRERANSIILVHNHPSGDCEPSIEDEEITEKLIEAGELLGVRLLDHVIVGNDMYFSFKDEKKI